MIALSKYLQIPPTARNGRRRCRKRDSLNGRGIEVNHETVRFWWNRFGPIFAAEIRKKRTGRMRALSGRRGAGGLCLEEERLQGRFEVPQENDEALPEVGCEASRNSPLSILSSTTTSTCEDLSVHGTTSSSSAPLHSPSGVSSGWPNFLSPVENSDLRISSDSA